MMMNCKAIERKCYGLIEVLAWCLPGGTVENHKKSVMIANAPPKIQTKYLFEYKCRALPLDQAVWSIYYCCVDSYIIIILRLVAMMESNLRPFEY
jgi:hypothetical protein